MITTEFLTDLEDIVGADGLVHDEGELITYESDGLVSHRSRPGAAVLPKTAEQVQARYLNHYSYSHTMILYHH